MDDELKAFAAAKKEAVRQELAAWQERADKQRRMLEAQEAAQRYEDSRQGDLFGGL